MTLIERIKEELTLEAVLDHFGAEVPAWRSRPFNIRCFLPGHEDMNPSTTIYPQEGRAWCHGCQRGGDILDLTAIMLNTDIKGAVEYWSRRLNLEARRPSAEEAARRHRARARRRIRERCHAFSRVVEKDMPRPRDPSLLSAWDAAWCSKDAIDEHAWLNGGPKDKAEAEAYIRELKAWRERWETFLVEMNGGWGGRIKSLAHGGLYRRLSFFYPPMYPVEMRF
ncbi:MAG: CHC2 zinc finger domain-containing protein [Actinomycetota bacterium]